MNVWQGQLRTIKHFTEERLGKRIEVDGALFSWLIPYCADILNKFRVGKDGRTPYERITAHKSKHFIIGFGEVVDFIIETDKNNRDKADSRVARGIFLGYAWRSTEYLIGTKEGIYQCRTVKRRSDEVAYDAEFTNYIQTRYDDFVLKGAKTHVMIAFPSPAGGDEMANAPLRGREFVPRRVYMRA